MWLTCLSDKPVAVVILWSLPFFVDFDMCILIGKTVNRERLESRRTRLNQCCSLCSRAFSSFWQNDGSQGLIWTASQGIFRGTGSLAFFARNECLEFDTRVLESGILRYGISRHITKQIHVPNKRLFRCLVPKQEAARRDHNKWVKIEAQFRFSSGKTRAYRFLQISIPGWVEWYKKICSNGSCSVRNVWSQLQLLKSRCLLR